MQIKPLLDKVVVKTAEAEEKTKTDPEKSKHYQTIFFRRWPEIPRQAQQRENYHEKESTISFFHAKAFGGSSKQ